MITLPTIDALGTRWWVEIFDSISSEQTQTIHEGLCFTIKQFDDKYSRFKEESLISTLNAGGFILEPDQMTIDLIHYGIQLYHQTNGVFNFLVGDALKKSGYDGRYSFSPSTETAIVPKPTKTISITKDKIILTKGQVDLGGYGKGYLIDLLAKELEEKYQIKEFLINGGGDMYATTQAGKPIEIFLEHPTTAKTIVAKTTLNHEGFAASSTYKRRWSYNNKTYTHIVDSKTGDSLDSTLGAFVKAPTAALADAWATTVLMSSPTNHLSMLKDYSVKIATYSETDNKFQTWGDFF